jgi:hypothetical protein
VNEDAALEALTEFADSDLGKRYPSAVKTFQDAWDRFTPFLAFPPELRRVISPPHAGYPLHQRDRVAELSAAESDQVPRPLPPTTPPRSSCCGWRSATSRTNEHATDSRNAASPPISDAPNPASSRAP